MKFRKPLKITSRSSTITNSFVQAIIPRIPWTEAEKEEALVKLGMSLNNISCIYCGSPSTDWDHLQPLVKNRRPTGFIHEIRNVVPSCAPCNQSKSGANWRDWMQSSAKGSPKSRGIIDIQDRRSRLEAFEKWAALSPLPLAEMAGVHEWDILWNYLSQIDELMKTAQEYAENIREKIATPLHQGYRTSGEYARVSHGLDPSSLSTESVLKGAPLPIVPTLTKVQPKMKQRDLMRRLYKQLDGNRDAVCREYAQAEHGGQVAHRRNESNYSPEVYALALWNDGVRKKWLQG